MSDREPEIFEVVPTRIGGPRGSPGPGRQRRPTSVVVVLLIALAVPALAFVGPRIEWRPEVDLSFLRPTPPLDATPTPRPTRRPPTPTPTPLPRLLVAEGAPSRVPIDIGGIRIAETTDGSLGPASPIQGETAAVVAEPGGDGWWCICFDRTWKESGERVVLVARHVDARAELEAGVTISARASSARRPATDFAVRVDAEFSPDVSTAYVATAVRADDRWTVELEAVDVAAGRSLGRETLTTLDLPPPDTAAVNAGYESYLGGPVIRLSPDGRRLVVLIWVDQFTAAGQPSTPLVSSWLVDLADRHGTEGPIASATPVGAELAARTPLCSQVEWLDDRALVAGCWNATSPSFAVSIFEPDGRLVSAIDYAFDGGWTTEPLLDRATRTVWSWSPMAHSLGVIDLERATVGTVAVDPERTAIGRPPPRSGPVPAPAWADFTSDYSPWQNTMLVPDPRGTRLYAIGLTEGEGSYRSGWGLGSTGVWVFDTVTRSLIDRWQPAASYGSLGLTRDERFVVAIGYPGTTIDGESASWEYSLNLHDASDGRLVAQLGRLGDTSGVLLPP